MTDANIPARMWHAADHMRKQHGPEHERHTMWAALADLLDERAAVWNDSIPLSRDHAVLAVADAYLGAVT